MKNRHIKSNPTQILTRCLAALATMFVFAAAAEANCDLKAKVEIINYLDQKLNLENSDLDWGKWETEPAKAIDGDKGLANFQASGACGAAAGTEGHVKYKIGDSNDWVYISWDVPWGIGATNTCKVKTSDPDLYDAYVVNSGGSSDCGGDGRILVLNIKVRRN